MWTANIVGQQQEEDGVGYVDFYGRLSDDGPTMRLLHAENMLPIMGQWARIIDEGAQKEQQDAAAKAEQDRQAAAAQAAQQQASQQAAQAQAQATQQANTVTNPAASVSGASNPSSFWGPVQLIFYVGLTLWLFSMRDSILRLFYSLTPHPAREVVMAALHSGRPYDSDRLSRLLTVAPENPIEREVRARQARDILQTVSAHARRAQAQLDEETEYLRGQAGLAEGMETHVRIRQRLDTILRAQGKL